MEFLLVLQLLDHFALLRLVDIENRKSTIGYFEPESA
jgi:hypothetical protein